MRSSAKWIVGLVVTLALAVAGPGVVAARDAPPGPAVEAARHDFGEVLQGAVVEHTFELRNDGGEPLRITGVQMTPPMQLATLPAVIPPSGRAVLALRLDTARVEGVFDGALVVQLAGAGQETRSFQLRGRIVPEFEIRPRPAFFLSTVRGVEKTATLDILHHGEAPLPLALPATQDPRYRLALETLEDGRRYRLTATLAALEAGQFAERLSLRRGDGRALLVGLNGRVRERVHTFPDILDFGRLERADLANPAVAVQNLMVYQHAGTAFEVHASTDVDGLRLQVVPGTGGDKVQVVATLAPETPPGPVRGTLVIATSDPGFRELRVPVSGEILPAPAGLETPVVGGP